MFTAKNPDVVQDAVDFLANLYAKISDDIKEQQKECTESYLSYCVEQMQKFSKQRNETENPQE